MRKTDSVAIINPSKHPPKGARATIPSQRGHRSWVATEQQAGRGLHFQGHLFLGSPPTPTLRAANNWVDYSNLTSFSHFRTFGSINGHPKQYILVDTTFNYRFHFGLPGNCL